MAWTERLFLAHLVLAATGGAALASTGDPIGSSVVIVRRVTAEIGPDKRDLSVGDGVRQDEAIEVARDGRGEIKFVDETKLALGPGARLVLDKFVYDPDQTSGTIALNLLKGAFRFASIRCWGRRAMRPRRLGSAWAPPTPRGWSGARGPRS